MTATLFRQPEAGTFRPALTGIAGTLAAEVTDTIRAAARHAPRSLQVSVGPSELGTPCIRRLAYKILDWPAKPNSDTDPWTSVIGTSVHAWMASAFEEENRQARRMRRNPGDYIGQPIPEQDRYLIEHRVFLPGGISGSCDLYDRDLHLGVDWKITSPANITRYRKNGPGQQYRTQGHLYGLGLQLAGETPRDVAIVFLPRGGRLDGLYIWTEPYQPQLAVDALKRYEATKTALVALVPQLDIENHPEIWQLFPTGDAYCLYCPFHLPGSADLSQGCPGHQPKTATPVKEK